MRSRSSTLNTIASVICTLLAVALGAGIGLFLAFAKTLPPVESLEEYRPNIVTQILSDNGEPIAEFYVERRILIPLKDVPQHLLGATLAVEDSSFYQHTGIDLRGIARAFVNNLRAGKIKEGGSTITQQLARNMFLTPERSLSRKIREAILSIQIERRYTKDEILEFYLNQVYYGSGAYGIEAAARTYFNKSISELTLGEAALLAGLPRAPSLYSPFNDMIRARERMKHALGRMVANGTISPQQAEEAWMKPVVLAWPSPHLNKAPYFVEYIRQTIQERYGPDAMLKQGLTVHTTLNLQMQRAAERVLRDGLIETDKRRGFRPPVRDNPGGTQITPMPPPGEDITQGALASGIVSAIGPDHLDVAIAGYRGRITRENLAWTKVKNLGSTFAVGDPLLVRVTEIYDDNPQYRYELALEQEPEVEGALVAIDPRSGAIKAMVGGYDFRRSQFNRAAQALRQPGSGFKPILYATALQQGWTPSDILRDEPFEYVDPWSGKVWVPVNFDGEFEGPVTVRHALEDSRNVPSVRLMEQVGPEAVIATARKLGIQSYLAPYLPLALGASDVTLLELTAAYGVFANQGVRTLPMAIHSATDRNGKILEEHFTEVHDGLDPHTAYLITNLLQGVIQNGTAKKAQELPFPIAGKTGTTNEFTDAGFIGYTPNLVVGVWTGMDDHTPIGRKETGAKAALPIWMAFMASVHENQVSEEFPVPEGITFREVDARTGLLATEDSERVIREAFLDGTEPTQFHRSPLVASEEADYQLYDVLPPHPRAAVILNR